MKMPKMLLLLTIAILIAAFFVFDLGRYLPLDALKVQWAAIESYRSALPGLTAVIFALIY